MNPLHQPLIELNCTVRPGSHEVFDNSTIKIYWASFVYSELGRLTLDSENYSSGPESGRLGNNPVHETPFIARLLRHFSRATCFWGQKNTWIWRDFIVFTEISRTANRHEIIKDLATKYDSEAAEKNILAPEMLLDDLVRESSDFRIYLFWRCWTGRSVKDMPDPRDAQNSIIRSQLAWAYSTQACDNLARLVKKAKAEKEQNINAALGIKIQTGPPQYHPLENLKTFLLNKFQYRLNPDLAFFPSLSGNGTSVYTNGRITVSFLDQDYNEWLMAQRVLV